MISRIIKKTVDLSKIQKVDQLEGPLYQLENGGHTFEITCLMDGAAAEVSGTVSARFLRADETTVYFTGTLSGNVASITLPQSCYNVNGRFGMVIFIAGNDITTAVYAVAGSVYRSTSDTIIDPTEEIPSLEELIAQIEACEDATLAANAAAAGAIGNFAPAYSTSGTYDVGDYVTYDGLMYVCIAAITTAEAWTASHWGQVTAGEEIKNNRIAIKDTTGNAVVVGWSANKKYIKLNESTATLSPVSTSSNVRYIVIEAQYGDVFTITASGGSASRAYGFVAGSDYSTPYKVLQVADSNVTLNKAVVIAPENTAYLVVNDTTLEGSIYCGRLASERITNNFDRITMVRDGINSELFNVIPNPTFSSGNWASASGTPGTSPNRIKTSLPTISGLDYFIKADDDVEFFPVFYNSSDGHVARASNPWVNECYIKDVAPSAAVGFRLTARKNTNAVLTDVVEATAAKIHFYKIVDTPLNYIPMRGKLIVNFGDSIFGNSAMRGQTSGASNESISHMVSMMTGATCEIAAFGGTHCIPQSSTSPMDFENLVTAITGIHPDWSEDAEGEWPNWSTQRAFAETKGGNYPSWVEALESIDFDTVDVVTVAYGTNDFSSQVTPAQFEASLKNSIQRLLKRFPNLLVVICTPIIRFIRQGGDPDADAETSGGDSGGSGEVISSDDYESSQAHAHLYDFAEKCEKVGKELHCPVCENYWSLGINTLNYSTFMGGLAANDLVHPNAKGRRLIANHLTEALNRL